MKVIFKDNIKSYLLIFLLSIIAGFLVVFFCEFPNNDLWAFSYWSSETFGFWMFSTSLIVLLSEKRKTATKHPQFDTRQGVLKVPAKKLQI